MFQFAYFVVTVTIAVPFTEHLTSSATNTNVSLLANQPLSRYGHPIHALYADRGASLSDHYLFQQNISSFGDIISELS